MTEQATRLWDDERQRRTEGDASTDAVTQAHAIEAAYLEHLADGPQQGGAAPTVRDETEGERLRGERAHRRLQRVEAGLAGKNRAAVWRRLMMASTLPDGAKVRLCWLSEYGAKLENSFASLRKIVVDHGGPLPDTRDERRAAIQRRLWTLKRWMRCAREAGWLERVPLTEDEDGELVEPENRGRFSSAFGNQFRVPPNVVAPGHPGWQGPRTWTNRVYAGRKQGRS